MNPADPRSETALPDEGADRDADKTRDAARSSLGLRRGLEILCLFDDAQPEWGVSEIARHLGIQKSQAHRSLRTLEEMGFLRKNARSRYTAGLRAFLVGTHASPMAASSPAIRHALRELSDQLDATISLRLIDEEELLIVDWYEGQDALPAHWPVGMRVPFNFGAGGKVFAASLPTPAVKLLIGKFGLPSYTERAITDPETFLGELEAVRRNGWAMCDGENIVNSYSVAAPVNSAQGHLEAVVVASRPSSKTPAEDRPAFIEAVVAAAQKVQALLIERSGQNTAASKAARTQLL